MVVVVVVVVVVAAAVVVVFPQTHAVRKTLKDAPDTVHYRSAVDGWTGLHHAAASGRPEIIDVLVKAKADLEVSE